MMKYLLTGIATLVLFYSSEAQAIQKGDVEIRAGVGFGIYSITSNDFIDDHSAGVPGLVSLGIGYQISDRWILGLNYERMGFITESDSNTKAVSNNIGLMAGYTILNSDKNSFMLSFEAGSSSFRYDDFKDEAYVIGSGPEFQLGGTWKHQFGKTVGMYINFAIPYFYYTNFENDDDDKLKVYQKDSQGLVIDERIFAVSMIGMNLRVGLLINL